MHLRLLPSLVLLPFLPAAASESAEQLVRATYKLANDSSTATGLAVRNRDPESSPQVFIVTARHVLDQMKGDRFRLIGRVRNENGTWQRKEHAVPVRKDGEPLWTQHEKHDLAVLPVPQEIDLEALPFRSLAAKAQLEKIHTGDNVRLAVFPERSEANGAGFAILRGGSIASFPFVPHEPHPVFLVDNTTWKGDSGGPVAHAGLTAPENAPLVIGFVRGMRNITDTNQESRFVERKTHYPLNVAEVLHAAFARDLLLKAFRKK